MSHDSIVEFCTLNLVMHPHSWESYANVWKKACELQRVIKVRGDQWGLVGTWYDEVQDEEPVIEGEIHRFTHIDPNEPWLNLLNMEEATEEELKEARIPSHLKPNKSSFRYALFPKSHRLAIQTLRDGKTFGVTSAQRFVESLLNDNRLQTHFPPVEVKIEQSRQELQKFLSTYNLTRLTIVVSRPNPDDLQDEEQDVLEELEKEKARRKKIEIVSEKGEALKPSETTLKMARVAASNGYVEADGETKDEIPVHFETKEHPKIDRFTYDREREGLVEQFRRHSAALIRRIRVSS